MTGYPKIALILQLVSIVLYVTVAAVVAGYFATGKHIPWTTIGLMLGIGCRQFAHDLAPREWLVIKPHRSAPKTS